MDWVIEWMEVSRLDMHLHAFALFRLWLESDTRPSPVQSSAHDPPAPSHGTRKGAAGLLLFAGCHPKPGLGWKNQEEDNQWRRPPKTRANQ